MPPSPTQRIARFLSLMLLPALGHTQVSIPDAMPSGAALQSFANTAPAGLPAAGEVFGGTRSFRSLDVTGGGAFGGNQGGGLDNRSNLSGGLDNFVTPSLDLGTFGLPFFERGFAIDQADVSLGPLGINFHSLSASVLTSDNINFTFEDPKHGTVGTSSLGFSVIFQPLQNIHLLLRGNLIALPFEKKIGLEGFGLQSPLAAALGITGGSRNLTQFQLYHKWDPGDWEIEFLDDYSVQYASGAGFLRNFQADGMLYAWDPFVFDELDPGGEFEFTPEAIAKGDRATQFDRTDRLDYSDQAVNNFDSPSLLSTNTLANTISFAAPLESQVSLSNYRQDRWDTFEGITTHETTIGGRLIMANNRDNLRFQPFGALKWIFVPRDSTGWSLGVRSQLTDNMSGITNYGKTGGSETWRIALRHQFNSRNLHAASFIRNVQLFNINKFWDYRFSRVMGIGMTGDAIIRGGEDINRSSGEKNDSFFLGLGFSKVFSPAVTYSNTLGYKKIKDEEGNGTDTADFENRLRTNFWENYTFTASHKWRYRAPDETPGSIEENIMVFEFSRAF